MHSINGIQVDEFTQAYVTCALWASNDVRDNGEDVNFDELGEEALAPETLGKMIADCQKYQTQHSALLKQAYTMRLNNNPNEAYYTPGQAGHDLWLTRCGHGAGFWYRGLGTIGEALDKTCGFKTPYDNIDLYIGDDGLIYY